MKRLIGFVIGAILVCCAEKVETEGDSVNQLNEEELSWLSWAESCGNPLARELNRNPIVLKERIAFGGESSELFYYPGDITVWGDTICITDLCKQNVVCFSATDGSLFWSYGNAGEGPREFSSISNITNSDDRIFINNQGNSRIEVVSKNGEYIGSISVDNPYDLAIINDTLLVVSSLAEANMLTLYRTETLEEVESFGSWDAGPLGNVTYSNMNLLTTELPGSRIAVSSCYEGIIRIYNTDTGEFEREFYRECPFEISEREGPMLYFHMYDITAYEDSMIIVNLPGFTVDREEVATSDISRIANLTVFDRYLSDGRYYDSFIMPGVCSTAIEYESGSIYAIDGLNGTVHVYSVLEE
ncbi:MAG: hypothetical protein KAR40_18015 [Candidatus Sabulitectum sp.]|nr:hypothetical protein [Candidatus Sabulitectum sp.]